MLLRSQRKGVNVDTGIGGTGVVLEGLNNVEVRTFSLGDAVLAVKLELSGDDGVLTPAVEVEGGLSEHEGAGIGEHRAGGAGGSAVLVEDAGLVPVLGGGSVGTGDRQEQNDMGQDE